LSEDCIWAKSVLYNCLVKFWRVWVRVRIRAMKKKIDGKSDSEIIEISYGAVPEKI